MSGFVGSTGQPKEGKANELIIPEYKVPDNLGGAAREGDLEKIKDFVQEGAKINGKYDKKLTPLHWAATMNQVDAIEILIDGGANLDSRDGHQSTPLLLAAFLGILNPLNASFKMEPIQISKTKMVPCPLKP